MNGRQSMVRGLQMQNKGIRKLEDKPNSYWLSPTFSIKCFIRLLQKQLELVRKQ